MDDNPSNVVYLRRLPFAQSDVEVIETIMQAHCGGEEIAIDMMEVTNEPMASICERLSLDGGTHVIDHHGWRFPVMQWKFNVQGGKRLVLIVIDQGQRRVFRHRIDKK